MKKLVPSVKDMMIFAILALLCAAVVTLLMRDIGPSLAVATLPIFTVAAIFGMRRSGQLDEAPVRVRVETDPD